jgi:hypothetical protein
MAKPLLSTMFGKQLIDAGIIPGKPEEIRRIVIDIEAGELVTMYVEYAADERLLEVIPGLKGVEIKHA